MEAVFTEIYERGGWSTSLLSGIGSEPRFLGEYLNFLQTLLHQPDIHTVVDIGCGDWTFSQLIDWSGVDYLGLDVVPAMVAALRNRYGRRGVRFEACDACLDIVPRADLWIVKDVLQHWPDEDVVRFLKRLPTCRYAILVNDIVGGGDRPCANGGSTPNRRDTECGGVRSLELTKAPFYLEVERLMTIRVAPNVIAELKEVLLWTNKSSLAHDQRAGQHDLLVITEESSTGAISQFLQDYQERSRHSGERGVVIAGGGKLAACTYVNVRMLRRIGCTLPIEVWCLGKEERDPVLFAELAKWDVECVDATSITTSMPAPKHGWELKPFAIYHSRFQEVLYLDADNVAVRNPEFLFETDEYRSTGALFWPDYWRTAPGSSFWRVMGIGYTGEREFESGQIVVDKARCDRVLALTLWLCRHGPEFYWNYCYGDKECFRAAWLRTGSPFAMPRSDVRCMSDLAMAQHDFHGERLFQHRHMRKWTFGRNERIPDFWFEDECLNDISNLRRVMLASRYGLTERDLADTEALAGSYWRYVRCGYDHRPMALGDDFQIGEGAGGLEQLYFVNEGNLCLCGGNLEVIARLAPVGDIYAGRWQIFERMPIVLEPLGVGREGLAAETTS